MNKITMGTGQSTKTSFQGDNENPGLLEKLGINQAICYIILCAIICFVAGCKTEQAKVAPKEYEQIENLEKVRTFSPDSLPRDTVVLVKETIFETSEDVFINGFIKEVEIDDQGRVYISAGKMGAVGGYIFEPDGSYLTTIARHGRGPGEYESISSIDILNNKLYLLAPRLQKYGVFSLDDFTHLYDKLFNSTKLENDAPKSLRATRLFAVYPDHLIVHFQVNIVNDINSYPHIYLYELTEDEAISGNEVLKLDKYRYYMNKPEPGSGGVHYPFTMPFTRHSLYTISKNGDIYTAWTDDFLIKKYNQAGEYQEAFFYPVQNPLLSISELEIANWQERKISEFGAPDSWPALHTMVLDDEERLWVATITESDSTFQWYVLNQQGEMLARFQMPGRRDSHIMISEPLIKIHNGYFYTHEFDFHEGIDQIIKHKIHFKQR